MLAAWRFAWPVLKALWRQAAVLLRVAEREITPLRAALGVAAAVTASRSRSRSSPTTAVAIGTTDYVGLSQIAPPPEAEGTRAAAETPTPGSGCRSRPPRSSWFSPARGEPQGRVVAGPDRARHGGDQPDRGRTEDSTKARRQWPTRAPRRACSAAWSSLACGVLLVALAPLIAGLMRGGEVSGAAAHWRRACRSAGCRPGAGG